MADDADITQARMEMEAQLVARQPRKHAMPAPTGRCLYCGDITYEIEPDQPVPADTPLFCSPECRQDWDRERTIRQAQGLHNIN